MKVSSLPAAEVERAMDLEEARRRQILGAGSVSGVMGFVGLVVPNLVRVLAGSSDGRLLALSTLTGAVWKP